MLTIQSRNSIRLVLVSSLVIFLFACQLAPPFFSGQVVIDDLSLHTVKKQNEAIKIAISKLENGKKLAAKSIIEQVLRINQHHQTAKLLNKQLTVSPEIIFKTNRVTQYQVKSGDTLGSIAKEWLENSIYFVSLALLNNIDNPAQIRPGLLLKIPVIKSSPLVKKEMRRSRANLELLKKYISAKRYTKSLTRMTTIYIFQSHHLDLLELQKQALSLLAVSKVSISERHHMIDQIKAISAKSNRRFLAQEFQQFIRQQLHLVLLDEFVLLFDDKSYTEAANKLIEAKKIFPLSKQNTHIFRTEKLLVNKLHENAIILRKNQQLEQAVLSWGKILQIQPENELALKYSNRTNKLLQRLKKLR